MLGYGRPPLHALLFHLHVSCFVGHGQGLCDDGLETGPFFIAFRDGKSKLERVMHVPSFSFYPRPMVPLS